MLGGKATWQASEREPEYPLGGQPGGDRVCCRFAPSRTVTAEAFPSALDSEMVEVRNPLVGRPPKDVRLRILTRHKGGKGEGSDDVNRAPPSDRKRRHALSNPW